MVTSDSYGVKLPTLEQGTLTVSVLNSWHYNDRHRDGWDGPYITARATC